MFMKGSWEPPQRRSCWIQRRAEASTSSAVRFLVASFAPRPSAPVDLPSRRAAPVAEVTLDLTEDVRHSECGELDTARRFVAVDRLDQPDGADLD